MIEIRASTARRLGGLAVGIMMLTAALSGWKTASAVSSGTLSLSPSVPSVASGGNFTVAVLQTSTSTTSGVQADVVFDQTKLQVTNVTRGAAYVGPPLSGATIGLGPLDTGTFKADAIAAGNASGTLPGPTVYYNSPGGDPTVPAGTNEAIVVAFQALADVTVAGVVGLASPEMLDATGAPMLVTVVSSGTLSLSPSSQSIVAGTNFTVAVTQTSTSTTSGAQADVVFDRTKLQVVDVIRGSAYVGPPLSGAAIGLGSLDVAPAKANAIADANASTGVLSGTAVYYNSAGGDPTVPAGTSEAFVVTLRACNPTAGTPLSLANAEMLDAGGSPGTVSVTAATVTITAGSVDTDCDTVVDGTDNCVTTWNANQLNTAIVSLSNGPGVPGDDATNANVNATIVLGDACNPDRDYDGRPEAQEVAGTGCPSASGDGTTEISTVNGYGASPANSNGLGPGIGGHPSWDSDGDSVRDGVECSVGTDPKVAAGTNGSADRTACNTFAGGTADTDGDGLQNQWEVCKWGTSQNIINTDGDALGDCREVMDVNGNGVVNASDGTLVKQAVFAIITGDLAAMDINANGTVNASDATLILQKVFLISPCL